MNIKGVLITFSTIFAAALLSAGIVFCIAYCDSSFQEAQPSYIAQDTAVQTTTPVSSTEDLTTAPPTQEAIIDYSYPQEYIEVDNSYFDNAVFLGDSRMQGLIKYSGLPKLRSYAYMGLTVEKYFTDQTFKIENSRFSASQALELDRNFDKVYLMFGTNELGWAFPEVFIEKYAKVIEHIQDCNPNAVIFVCSVIPVASFAHKTKSFLKNETVWTYNQLLQELAQQKETYYLDFASILADETGALPANASSDGIHLGKSYVTLCFDYMRSHAIQPKPQEKISNET